MPPAIHGFSNPVCAAALVANKERYALFGNLTPAQREKLHVESIGHVESVEVELTLGLIPKLQVSISEHFREMLHIINSEVLEVGDKYLEVQLGYLGKEDGSPVMSPVFRGLMQIPDVTLGEQISVSLVALGEASRLTTTEDRRIFNKTTRREIMQVVARGPNPGNPRNLELNAQFVDEAPSSAAKKLLDQPISAVQGNLTDFDFIRKLAADCDCGVRFFDKAFVLIPRSLRTTRVPKYTLRLFDFNNGALGQGEYPVLSVSSPTKALYSQGALQVLLRDIDSQKQQTVTVVVSDASHPYERIGDSKAGDVKASAPEAAGKPARGKAPGSVAIHEPPTPAGEQRAKNLTVAAAETTAVNLEVETLGIPDILPGDLVAFRGLGLRYDRNYEVESLTHTFSGGEFKTNLKLLGNTYDMLVRKQQEAPEGPVNKAKPAPQDAGKVTKQAKPG